MMLRGKPPYLECSTHGDRRFSAFVARPRSLEGRSIEEAYQAMKVFPDGSTGLSWRQAKGRHPVNLAECRSAYDRWWLEWAHEQDLLPVLLAQTGLSDKFGREGSTCQADTLWRIRNGDLSFDVQQENNR